MPGCCSPFERSANQQFNQKRVAQELKIYREKGPGPTTRLLTEGIAQSGTLDGSVLDIVSGIGALTFALLERGATSASPSMRRQRTLARHVKRPHTMAEETRFDSCTPISSRLPPKYLRQRS